MVKNDRFFGLHFDFHANTNCKIGQRTNAEDIEWYIKETGIDFIQCDCKGHPGISSYNTKVGTPCPNIINDNLKIWCDTAHKNNIPIYVHYSGVADIDYVKKYPNDAMWEDEKNTFFTEYAGRDTCVYGPYVDKRMIPQLKELITNYGIDGVWVDGDCWAVRLDYSPNMKPYIYNGISKEEHTEIMREGFKKYLKHYVNELHSFSPDFKIASNWAYSSYMPEEPDIDVDFLSGDYPSNDSVHIARYEARCLSGKGKPWDLMAWGFHLNTRSEKSAIQLCQEAAMTLSLGGGFQVYANQNRDGSIKTTNSSRYRELGSFMKNRRINFKKKPIAQTAIFFSKETYYKKASVFCAAGCTNALIGATNTVLDAQYTTDIITDYQLYTVNRYSIVLVPEWENMSNNTKNLLVEYAKQGGNLIITGYELCMQMSAKYNLGFEPYGDKEVLMFLTHKKSGNFMGINQKFVNLTSGEGIIYTNNDLRDGAIPAYKTTQLNKGTITYIPFDLGAYCFNNRSYIITDYLKDIYTSLSRPWVEINKKNIDITMQKNKNGIILNLINMYQGRHTLDIGLYDEIPPIYDIMVKVNKPFKNATAHTGENIEFTCNDNSITIKIDKLYIHSIILLD